jgi:hypothetical protein
VVDDSKFREVVGRVHSMITSRTPTEDSAIMEAIQKAVAPEQWQALLARLKSQAVPVLLSGTHTVRVSVKKLLYKHVFNVLLRCWSPVQSTIEEGPFDVTITVVFSSLGDSQGFFNHVQDMKKSDYEEVRPVKKSDYEEGPPAKKSKKSKKSEKCEESENAENPENPETSETQENPDQAQ